MAAFSIFDTVGRQDTKYLLYYKLFVARSLCGVRIYIVGICLCLSF